MSDALSVIAGYLISWTFFEAALMTLALTLLAMFFGMLLGIIFALIQESRIKTLRGVVLIYLWLFRGTPVLLQIIFVFNVLPVFGIVLSGFISGVIALSLNQGAYMTEIFRSGLQAVGKRQRIAGSALGMKNSQVMRYVVLPQALRIVVPPTGNQFMGMLKESALVSVIAVQELLLVADQTASANFRYLEALSTAAIYYLALTTVFMVAQTYIERWLAPRKQGAKVNWTQRLLRMTAQTRSSQ